MPSNKYERSVNYRKNFLKQNKGVFGSGIYHCSYCGRLLSIKKLRIDHLIPVHKVKHFGIGRILMKFKGISNINDVRNLVPSCERCNSKKSDKMGFWFIKGEIGRHFMFWLLLWSFVLAVLTILSYKYHNEIFSVFQKFKPIIDNIDIKNIF